jgi:acylphosphatase
MKQVHIFLSGKVQGVGFRYFTRRIAEELDIKGWVRNLYDGRVEVIAEGDRLEEFVAMVKKGPVGSKVDDIEVCELDEEIGYSGFEIRVSSNDYSF